MSSIDFSPVTIVFMLTLFFILLIISAFFSLTETSLFSINKIRLDFLLKQQNRKAISIHNIINEPDRLLSTILTGNNIINTAMTTIGTTVSIYYLGEWGVVAATFLVTALLLLFSETFPKVLATQFPDQLSFRIVKPYEWVRWFLSPIVTFITYITYLSFNLFGIKIEYKRTIFSREEVKHIIRESGETGALVDGEHNLLHKVFELNDRLAKEIMVPRNKIVAINADMEPEKIIRIITEEGYTRYPVYRNCIDNIIGIIHTKTIINILVNNQLFVLEDLIIKPYFVFEEEKISKILKEFKQKELHIAMVRNSRGIISGLIEIKDILKVIFGELREKTVPV
ncbi:MAG: CNNM domain-containing protein [Candidatus Loosdrechtia sp.]|uniref:hemolysin family protein n=1 Tax=Candidatus Loosdrechtia sp. TaxID=3101272 RepID=UPI003A74DAF2|nr:MAG: hemolysin family protein [Candidatus Jettenia sp. AMX2]